MKKLLLVIVLLFISIVLYSQDIVYDSIRGDRFNWRKVKKGSQEDLISISYENLGIISRSKVLLSAGIWTGLQENVDYKLIDINTDTLLFEYKSDPPLNLILYKYFYNDTTFISFFGLRKAELGSELFSGKYLFVCPIIKGSTVNVYEDIGKNKKLFISVTDSINESLYRDYIVSGQVSFQTIKGSKQILVPTIVEFIEDNNKIDKINIYPNPTNDFVNIQILENKGTVLRIFNNKPQLVYQNYIEEDLITLDISEYKSGLYILVFSLIDDGTIKYVYKLIKK